MKFTVADKKQIILSLLYNLRTCTKNQIIDYIQLFDDASDRTLQNLLSVMTSTDHTIEKKGGYFEKDSFYVLTQNGIIALRKNGLYNLDIKHNVIPSPEQIIPLSKLILTSSYEHQLQLNQFVIDFMKQFPELEFDYYDEKFANKFTDNINPDGILKVKDTLYFLEMDMNTEKQSRLLQKWNSYGNYINSKSNFDTHYKIKVMFILHDEGKKKLRKHNLRNYIDLNLSNYISRNFDLYIDTASKLLYYMYRSINNIPDNLIESVFANYDVRKNIRIYEDSESYDYYVSLPQATFSEFVIDDFRFGNMYTYCKYIYFPSAAGKFCLDYGRELNYLIIVNDEREAVELVRYSGYCHNMYFTTADRLTSMSLANALFVVDSFLDIRHLSENNPNVLIDEQIFSVI